MKSPRIIVVKTLLNPDEFIDFNAECAASDVSHSKQLRDLAKSWATQSKNKRNSGPQQWPVAGQNMAMSLPARANYGARMRC